MGLKLSNNHNNLLFILAMAQLEDFSRAPGPADMGKLGLVLWPGKYVPCTCVQYYNKLGTNEKVLFKFLFKIVVLLGLWKFQKNKFINKFQKKKLNIDLFSLVPNL